MKRRRVTIDEERELLLGMITSKEFLRDVNTILDTSLLRNPHSRTIAEWCIEFYETYEDAPKQEINHIFDGERRQMRDEDAEYIERMLLSFDEKELQGANIEHRFDRAEGYLKRRKLELFTDEIKGDLDSGDIASAENRIATFLRVERPRGEGLDILEDHERVNRYIVEEEETLISVDGALGEVIGPFFRGDLVAIAGPPKRGKTWWLLFYTLAALILDMKVLFVSLEMLERQVVRRVVQMFTGTATREGTAQIPVFVESDEEENGKKLYTVTHDEVELHRASIEEWQQSLAAFRRHNPSSRFRVLTFPQSTLTTDMLEIHLDNLEHYDNFVPDVIVVDYADIMGTDQSAPREYRHWLDWTWKNLRKLAQKRNALVLTGTQTSKETLKKDGGADNVAEDMRKLAHVSKMIGLNQSKDEYRNSLMRVGLWMERHGYADIGEEAVVAQSLHIGKPCLDSRRKRAVRLEGVYNDSSKKRTQ